MRCSVGILRAHRVLRVVIHIIAERIVSSIVFIRAGYLTGIVFGVNDYIGSV